MTLSDIRSFRKSSKPTRKKKADKTLRNQEETPQYSIMNCGVFCVREYLRLMGIDSGAIIKELDGRVTRRGLSIQDIIEVLTAHGFGCEGFYDHKVCNDFPYIMYDALYRHYYLIISGDDHHIWMCDPLLGYVRVRRCFFRLFWRKYYVSLRYSVI